MKSIQNHFVTHYMIWADLLTFHICLHFKCFSYSSKQIYSIKILQYVEEKYGNIPSFLNYNTIKAGLLNLSLGIS